MSWDSGAQNRTNASGNMSLGQGGYDDGQGDTTNGYAKKDCRYDMLQVLLDRPLADALPTTNLTESRTRTSAGIWSRVYTAGGSVASFVQFRLPEVIRTGTAGATQIPQSSAYALHGYKVTSIDVYYIIATADATTIAVTAQTETAIANNTARANSSITPLGAVTYQNPIGTTVAVMPVAQQAAPYQVRAVFGTPVFQPTNTLTFELALTLPNTCALTLSGLFINYSLAIY